MGMNTLSEKTVSVLTLDDDEQFLRLMQRMLGKPEVCSNGDGPAMLYTPVSVAQSMEDAVDILQRETKDVVLFDVDLGDGVDPVTNIKRIRDVCECGIVVVTGGMCHDTEIRLREAGFQHIVYKDKMSHGLLQSAIMASNTAHNASRQQQNGFVGDELERINAEADKTLSYMRMSRRVAANG